MRYLNTFFVLPVFATTGHLLVILCPLVNLWLSCTVLPISSPQISSFLNGFFFILLGVGGSHTIELLAILI